MFETVYDILNNRVVSAFFRIIPNGMAVYYEGPAVCMSV
jgi:hypothetical protein